MGRRRRCRRGILEGGAWSGFVVVFVGDGRGLHDFKIIDSILLYLGKISKLNSYTHTYISSPFFSHLCTPKKKKKKIKKKKKYRQPPPKKRTKNRKKKTSTPFTTPQTSHPRPQSSPLPAYTPPSPPACPHTHTAKGALSS